MAKSKAVQGSLNTRGNATPFKNVDLEVLRCVAIAMTLFVHLPELLIWKPAVWEKYIWFYGGVDLFFVISGYIITVSLISSIKKESRITVVMKSFWAKRVFRILPMAYLWTIIPVILVFTFNTAGMFSHPSGVVRDGIANITQTANFNAQQCNLPQFHDKCGLGKNGQNPLGPFWSLSTEEQFYIVFPLLLLFISRRHLIVLLAAIPIILFFVNRHAEGFWVLRFDSLVVGVLLAFAQTKSWYKEFYPNILEKYGFGVIFLIFSTLLIGLVGAMSIVSFSQSIIVIISAMLVFVASYNKDIYTRPFKWIRPLVLWGGDRSYAIYLIHVPSYLLANEIYLQWRHQWDSQAIIFIPLMAFALILIFTELSTYLVERPLRRYGRNLAKQIESTPAKRPRGRPRKITT